jgi:PKD repeat protein
MLRATRTRAPRVRSTVALILAAVLVSLLPAASTAAPGDIGHLGPSAVGAGSAPSGSKPESKLWFNDGLWWGSLWNIASSTFHIYRLDLAGLTWVDTGVQVDNRSSTRADALWDGTKLYIASHRFSSTNTTGYPARLYRYSYNAAGKTYTLDAGFPATINDYRTETLVIDKDTTGMLWATWTQNSQVYVSHTNGSDTSWVTPYLMPGPGTTVNADDISSVISFRPTGQTGRIGVMWSNQNDDKVYFAMHVDGTSDTLWDSSKTAIQGSGVADDHINLKSVEADGSGKVYAAIKTSHTTSSAPLIMALVFNPATGSWSSSVVGRVSDSHTRPIILIDEEHAVAHVYLTGPQPPSTSGQSGGSIYEKTAPLSTLAFGLGVGTPVIRDADVPDMNNATSTKQNVSSATGVVVLAGNDTTDQYWWHYDALGGTPPVPQPPVADFTAAPVSGSAPLSVDFKDTSTNLPTSWAWDFDNNGSVDATTQNPTFSYAVPGTYSVKLTSTNTAGSDSETKTNLITVGPPLTFATFTPTADSFVSSTSVSTNYGTNAALRVRDSSTIYNSYLAFTTSGLTGPVRSVKLRLFVTDASPDGGSVYSVGNGWTEGGINWTNAPALPPGAIKAIGATPAVGSWVEVDLGTAIGGNGPFSFAIASNNTNSAYYSSRQGTNPPQLVVGYEAGGPGPSPSASPSTAPSASPSTAPSSSPSTAPSSSPSSAPSASPSTAPSSSPSSAPSSSPSAPPSGPPPATITVVASADARVNQAVPTSNYGSDPALRIRLDPTGGYRSFLRFPVAGITGTVSSVKLRLYVTDASPGGGTVYPTSGSWVESTINWNNQPAATGGAIRVIGSVALDAWAEIDLTGAVTTNGTYNLLISDGNTNSTFYSSREGAHPPELVITQNP